MIKEVAESRLLLSGMYAILVTEWIVFVNETGMFEEIERYGNQAGSIFQGCV